MGVGLAATYGIIQRHRGRMEVQGKEGGGTAFTIHLPLGLFRLESGIPVD